MLPKHAKHMTDRSLLYTAATRASERLVFCGDYSLLEEGLTKVARSSGRRTNVGKPLREYLAAPPAQ